MRFLADESCDFAVVRAQRGAGYDVLAVAELFPRAEDVQVIQRAIHEDRILITEDKDFGQLFFAHRGKKPRGVVLLRYPSQARGKLSEDIVRLVRRHGRKLRGCFVVIEPGRVRIAR